MKLNLYACLVLLSAWICACESTNREKVSADAGGGAAIADGEGEQPQEDAATSPTDGTFHGDAIVDGTRPAPDSMPPGTFDASEADAQRASKPEAGPEDASPHPDGDVAFTDVPSTPVDAAIPCGGEQERECPDPTCDGGVQECVDGVWGPCVGPAEQCDGLDNDCDGETDEDFPDLGERCSAGIGACTRAGEMECSEDGTETRCGAIPGSPVAEVCDGLDNDCDGEVDQDFDLGVPCAVGIGACTGEGTSICAPDGTLGCDAVEEFPSAERCNQVDDDCDGDTDEELGLGDPCVVGVGACEAQGRRVCGLDGAVMCGARAGVPLPEVCNGRDDNCDGAVDEGFGVGDDCTSGRGACAQRGHVICDPNGDGALCDAISGEPTVETCNGLDDDCDGVADDGFRLGESCEVGVGACGRSGTIICKVDGTARCSAAPGAPADEVCDGLDNDCNGETDEDSAGGPPLHADCYEGPPGTLDVGVCRAGSHECDDGEFGACDQQVLPSAEVCDTLDNDCDGVVDDGIPGLGDTCNSGRLGACSPGQQVCTPLGLACRPDLLPAPEICNDLDDDCDGIVDNGTGRGDACSSGAGICARRGRLVCTGGGGTACDAVPGAPDAADICDGLDNDCDGVTDEGCPVALATAAPVDGAELPRSETADHYRTVCPQNFAMTSLDYWLHGANILLLRANCRQLNLVEDQSSTPRVYSVALGNSIALGMAGNYWNIGNLAPGSITCPPGQVITGMNLQGTAGGNQGFQALRGTCSTMSVGNAGAGFTFTTQFAGQSANYAGVGGSPFQFNCPANTVATGIHGDAYTDSYLRSVGFMCSAVNVSAR